jgi:hypothetical protein
MAGREQGGHRFRLGHLPSEPCLHGGMEKREIPNQVADASLPIRGWTMGQCHGVCGRRCRQHLRRRLGTGRVEEELPPLARFVLVGRGADAQGKLHWLVRTVDSSGVWQTVDDFQLGPGYTASASKVATDVAGNLLVSGSAYEMADTPTAWAARRCLIARQVWQWTVRGTCMWQIGTTSLFGRLRPMER